MKVSKFGPLHWLLLAGLAVWPATGCLHGEAIPVRIQEETGGYTLIRGGAPYFIKGAGGDGDLAQLAAIGGNSLRTWGDTTLEDLDRAHAAGLSVCVGLWIDHERHGFDYNDDAAVAEQIRRHCATIDRLKDHPAVLMWGIGNEVELQHTNHRVWDVIEAVAAHAKRVDPHHPTMTVIAQAPAKEIRLIRERCPSIDILGCNSYGGIGILARDIRAAGWDKPYIVTEWGNDGTWEVDKTAWGAEVEECTSGKAYQRALRYGLIVGDRELCLGSYAFHWGSKQETTPTWYGLFLDDGSRTESVEVLQYLWTGSMPEHQAPRIGNLEIDGQRPKDSVVLQAGAPAEVRFDLQRGDWDKLEIRWELAPESDDKRFGGDAEARPPHVPIEVVEQGHGRLLFKAPAGPGAYRLYLTLHGPGNTATAANFPFRVE